MRIGLDVREAFRDEPRGIGLYVRHLMREFGALAGNDEFLLYHQLPHKTGSLDIPSNMRTVHTDIRGDRARLWERLQMPFRIRRDRLDIYHGTYNTLPPRLRFIPGGAPMVVTLHDVIVTYWPDDIGDPFVRYARDVTKRVVRDAAIILTVSEWSKRDICERYGCDPAKVRLSLNGVHPEFLAGAPSGAADLIRTKYASGQRYVFSPGAVLERKNTGRMLIAWGQLCARGANIPPLLLVSGLGREADRFRERAAQAGCGDRVRILPYLDRSELVALYAGAELTVYPSLIEGFGIPVIESLVLGTPVAASNTSAMPEAGADHANYFDPNSIESMAHTIEHALAHRSDFDKIRPAAIARARTFTWQRTAESVLATYREIVR